MSRRGLAWWTVHMAAAGLTALFLVGCSGVDGGAELPPSAVSQALPATTVEPADRTPARATGATAGQDKASAARPPSGASGLSQSPVTAASGRTPKADATPQPSPDAGVEDTAASDANVRIAATPVQLKRPRIDPELVASIPTLGRQLGKDDIRPIYDPLLVTVQDSPMLDNDFVLGLEINGEAHAYPIRLLNGREMVNDVVGGVPILATW